MAAVPREATLGTNSHDSLVPARVEWVDGNVVSIPVLGPGDAVEVSELPIGSYPWRDSERGIGGSVLVVE